MNPINDNLRPTPEERARHLYSDQGERFQGLGNVKHRPFEEERDYWLEDARKSLEKERKAHKCYCCVECSPIGLRTVGT